MGRSFCNTNRFSAMLVFALLAGIHLISGSKGATDHLRVLVPRKVGFEQFAGWEKNDLNDSTHADGFSVEVFLQALHRLSGPVPPMVEFIPFGDGKSTPSYDGMVDEVCKGGADAIVADITITKERMGKVDFTMPYMESALVMVAPFKYGISAGAMWGFLHPFSWQLWLALALFFITTGLVLYILENKNPDFSNHAHSFKDGLASYPQHHQTASSPSRSYHTHTISQNMLRVSDSDEGMDKHGNANIANGNSSNNAFDSNSACQQPLPHAATLPFDLDEKTARPLETPNSAVSRKQRLLNAYWFTSLCVFYSQQEAVRTHAGRVIVVSWLFIVLILTSSYTASLASLLSSQQAYSTIKDFDTLQKSDIKVGTLEGSFIPKYLQNHDFAPSRLKQYASEEEYAAGLQKGSNKGGVGAILDELPYIQIMLQSECGFNIVGDQIAYFGGFGFAFSKNSNWTKEVSKGILALAQEGVLQKLKDGWIGGSSRCMNSTDDAPDHLRLRSFGGLFAILAGVYAACLFGRLSIKAFTLSQKSPI